MSDQNRDYAAIWRNVEKRVSRQKRMYRITFFLMHILIYVVTMVAVWGTLANYPQLWDRIVNPESSAAFIVILPAVLWAVVILFHAASLYLESGAGEQAIRERMLMREVGEEILRQGLADEGMLEKPKRRAASLETEQTRLSDDGEILAGEDQRIEPSDYSARANQVIS